MGSKSSDWFSMHEVPYKEMGGWEEGGLRGEGQVEMEAEIGVMQQL